MAFLHNSNAFSVLHCIRFPIAYHQQWQHSTSSTNLVHKNMHWTLEELANNLWNRNDMVFFLIASTLYGTRFNEIFCLIWHRIHICVMRVAKGRTNWKKEKKNILRMKMLNTFYYCIQFFVIFWPKSPILAIKRYSEAILITERGTSQLETRRRNKQFTFYFIYITKKIVIAYGKFASIESMNRERNVHCSILTWKIWISYVLSKLQGKRRQITIIYYHFCLNGLKKKK